MKSLLTITLIILAMTASQANAAFLNHYAVSNWTKTVNKGSVNTTGAPNSIQLTGSNTTNPVFFGNRNQDFTIAAFSRGIVTFTWNYVTKDLNGAKFDPFGFLLNGVFTQLTNDTGPKTQSGSFSVHVLAGDIFGFRQNSFDSQLGVAKTVVSNFSGPSQVPVPAAFWLMGVPVAGLMSRKRKAKA